MVEIIKECDFYELRAELWSGAVDAADTVMEHDRTDELMQLLEDIFYEPTDIMQINDFLWFDSGYIYETLDIAEEI